MLQSRTKYYNSAHRTRTLSWLWLQTQISGSTDMHTIISIVQCSSRAKFKIVSGQNFTGVSAASSRWLLVGNGNLVMTIWWGFHYFNFIFYSPTSGMMIFFWFNSYKQSHLHHYQLSEKNETMHLPQPVKSRQLELANDRRPRHIVWKTNNILHLLYVSKTCCVAQTYIAVMIHECSIVLFSNFLTIIAQKSGFIQLLCLTSKPHLSQRIHW